MNDENGENFEWHDIGAAFGLLTRLPIPVDHQRAGERGARSVWAYPVVGGALGALAGVFGLLLLYLGAPVGVSAAGALAVLILSTGALHEDGIADCADGLGGGRDREQCLEIMRDSRIGAFGAAALALVILARWSAIESLIGAGSLFWPMVAVGAASRLPMVLAMFIMDPARTDGLSSGIGTPPTQAVLAAFFMALLIAVFALGWGGIAVLFWAGLATLPLLFLAQARIGGQTGDILGGSQQLAEIGALAAAAASAGQLL